MALTDRSQPGSVAPGLGQAGILAVGDTLAFLIFAAIGRASHGEAAGLAAILQIAGTAAPFAAGWFAVAPFSGVFRNAIACQPRRALARTALAWSIACPIGLGLRALIRQTGIPITFAIITYLTNLVLLLGWHGALAWLRTRRPPGRSDQLPDV
jgi:hypothetical protein